MKRAIIFYQSKTGTTKTYACAIGEFLQTQNVNTVCFPVEEYHESLIENVDYLLLGCWTKGLMVLFQKPDEIWNEFARKISIPVNLKVALFATYKIRIGSMFRNMREPLKQLGNVLIPNLKSRNGKLSDMDISVLKKLIID